MEGVAEEAGESGEKKTGHTGEGTRQQQKKNRLVVEEVERVESAVDEAGGTGQKKKKYVGGSSGQQKKKKKGLVVEEVGQCTKAVGGCTKYIEYKQRECSAIGRRCGHEECIIFSTRTRCYKVV